MMYLFKIWLTLFQSIFESRAACRNTRYALLLGVILLTGCEDDRVLLRELENDCVNHYRAKSYKVASRVCLEGANKGIVRSQWLLANIYYYNLGDLGKSKERALEWFTSAADNGLTDAQVFVGESYIYGDGVEKDYEKAYHYFSVAADNFDASAEFNLGMMFYNGYGRKKDFSAAISWLKRAASQNHSMSINNLAWLYATSDNRSLRNPKKALFWAEKLADDGENLSIFLDTKAAAYALAGEFEKAVQSQSLAIEALPEDVDESKLVEFQKRLESYQNGYSWIEGEGSDK
ncbi:tetratricopeptide repeat protein [Aliikangiella sp. G2MR2-5]|uniref:tetratricopeptide repeat protein n=1 Tax=Aliikangiella sp. G2MR2-5 TaxID=2788943 RepID=UPI0018AC7310|nr:tetratricopeptide repeat protein [Aliikangiella sp. G2MR2-5]